MCLQRRISSESMKKPEGIRIRAKRATGEGRLTFHHSSFSTFEFSQCEYVIFFNEYCLFWYYCFTYICFSLCKQLHHKILKDIETSQSTQHRADAQYLPLSLQTERTESRKIIPLKTKIPAQTDRMHREHFPVWAFMPDPVWTVFEEGSQCEAVNLTTVSHLFSATPQHSLETQSQSSWLDIYNAPLVLCQVSPTLSHSPFNNPMRQMFSPSVIAQETGMRRLGLAQNYTEFEIGSSNVQCSFLH